MSTSVTINEDIGQPIYANYSNNSNICQSVQLDNFIFVKVVGRGSFGKVMLVSLGKDDNLKYYAMKILKKNMITKKNQKMHL